MPPPSAADSGAETPTAFVSEDLIVTPTSITVALGGAPLSEVLTSMRCVPGSMRPSALGTVRDGFAEDCTWASTHCHGTVHFESWIMSAASGRVATLEAEATAPEDAATCARFDGDYSASVISDPAAGGPGPGPQFEGASCLRLEQVVSGEICATVTQRADVSEAVTYRGACCLGERISAIPLPESPVVGVSSDGRAVVEIVTTLVSPADVAADAVVAVIARPSGSTDVHLATALAGDPVLAAGTGFGISVAVEGTDLVVSVAGGAPHRTPL